MKRTVIVTRTLKTAVEVEVELEPEAISALSDPSPETLEAAIQAVARHHARLKVESPLVELAWRDAGTTYDADPNNPWP